MHTQDRKPPRLAGACALVLAALGGVACAGQQPAPAPAPGHQGPQDPAFRAAFAHCLGEQGLSPPAPGDRPPQDAKRPDHDKLASCLSSRGIEPPAHGPGMHPPGPPQMPEDPRLRQALEACVAEQGLPPPPPPPPPPAPGAGPQPGPAGAEGPDKGRLDACLKAKGVDLPPPPVPPARPQAQR